MQDGYGNELDGDILKDTSNLTNAEKAFFNINYSESYYSRFVYINSDGTIENGALTGHFHNCHIEGYNRLFTQTNAYNVTVNSSQSAIALINNSSKLSSNYNINNCDGAMMKLSNIDRVSVCGLHNNVKIDITDNPQYNTNLIIDSSITSDVTLTLPSNDIQPNTYILYQKDDQTLLKRLSDAFGIF